MTPRQAFDAVWYRCAELESLFAYIRANTTSAISADELLRSEWAMRVGALDLYVHELVCQQMVQIFEGSRPTTPSYLRFAISMDAVHRIRNASTLGDAVAAFDLEVRLALSRETYQHPEKIADGIRLVSSLELWNEVALSLGANESSKISAAKVLKRELALIVDRRNKIVHEGDMQPGLPRTPWPISRSDVAFVKERIESVVVAVDLILK